MARHVAPYRRGGHSALKRSSARANARTSSPVHPCSRSWSASRWAAIDSAMTGRPAGREAQRLAAGVDEVGRLHEPVPRPARRAGGRRSTCPAGSAPRCRRPGCRGGRAGSPAATGPPATAAARAPASGRGPGGRSRSARAGSPPRSPGTAPSGCAPPDRSCRVPPPLPVRADTHLSAHPAYSCIMQLRLLGSTPPSSAPATKDRDEHLRLPPAPRRRRRARPPGASAASSRGRRAAPGCRSRLRPGRPRAARRRRHRPAPAHPALPRDRDGTGLPRRVPPADAARAAHRRGRHQRRGEGVRPEAQRRVRRRADRAHRRRPPTTPAG